MSLFPSYLSKLLVQSIRKYFLSLPGRSWNGRDSQLCQTELVTILFLRKMWVQAWEWHICLVIIWVKEEDCTHPRPRCRTRPTNVLKWGVHTWNPSLYFIIGELKHLKHLHRSGWEWCPWGRLWLVTVLVGWGARCLMLVTSLGFNLLFHVFAW